MPHAQDGAAQRAYRAPDRSSPTTAWPAAKRQSIRAANSRRDDPGVRRILREVRGGPFDDEEDVWIGAETFAAMIRHRHPAAGSR
jgi:hypothetical protein